MSKRGARGMIPAEILQSPAWRALSSDARAVLVALVRQCNGRDNGLLTFSAKSGAALGLTADATQHALAELRVVGLIDARGEPR
jgi:hypothetical protein